MKLFKGIFLSALAVALSSSASSAQKANVVASKAPDRSGNGDARSSQAPETRASNWESVSRGYVKTIEYWDYETNKPIAKTRLRVALDDSSFQNMSCKGVSITILAEFSRDELNSFRDLLTNALVSRLPVHIDGWSQHTCSLNASIARVEICSTEEQCQAQNPY